MLINGRYKKTFNFDDINSLVSFEDWIKLNLSFYTEDSKVPVSHMLDFIEYIRKEVQQQRVIDKKKWLDKLDALKDRATNE